jgi:RNA polymerase II subunit A small phosphatase-like protein
LKDLNKIKRRGFDLARVLIVDDTPQKVHRHYGNAVYVRPFLGDPADEELLHLRKYLRSVSAVDNVRRIEKRGWRERIL